MNSERTHLLIFSFLLVLFSSQGLQIKSALSDDFVHFTAEEMAEIGEKIITLFPVTVNENDMTMEDVEYIESLLSGENALEQIKPFLELDPRYKHFFLYMVVSLEHPNPKLYKELKGLGAKRIIFPESQNELTPKNGSYLDSAIGSGNLELISLVTRDYSSTEIQEYFDKSDSLKFYGITPPIIDYFLSIGIPLPKILINGLCSLFPMYDQTFSHYRISSFESDDKVALYEGYLLDWVNRPNFSPSDIPLSKDCLKEIKENFPNIFPVIKSLYHFEETPAEDGGIDPQSSGEKSNESSDGSNTSSGFSLYQKLIEELSLCHTTKVRTILSQLHDVVGSEEMKVLVNDQIGLRTEILSSPTRDSTPLGLTASLRDCDEALELLLKYGADPNIKDGYKRTPLLYAVTNENIENVSILAPKTNNLSEAIKLAVWYINDASQTVKKLTKQEMTAEEIERVNYWEQKVQTYQNILLILLSSRTPTPLTLSCVQ